MYIVFISIDFLCNKCIINIALERDRFEINIHAVLLYDAGKNLPVISEIITIISSRIIMI